MTTIYTIGYEGVDIDRFLATLNIAGVKTLADVRDVPLSRKKGFSKNVLRAHLAEAGIDYIHFRSLGDPKPGREAARRGDFDNFRKIFGAHIEGHEAQAALRDLARTARRSLTCMMCFERSPIHCHRSIVAEHLLTFSYTKFDLFVDRLDYYEQNPEKLPSNHTSEGLAAAE